MSTISTAALDLLYIVRPGDDNDELRYSLRSVAANLPHRSVWVVGHCPAWVRNVTRLELEPLTDGSAEDNLKFDNQRQSLAAACAHPELSETFVLLNDDMFVMEPTDPMPVYHLGETAPYLADLRALGFTEANLWHVGVQKTFEQMQDWGYQSSLCYEAHTPLPFVKDKLAALLASATCRPFLWGTAYDACGAVAGTRGPNAKRSTQGARDLLACLTLGIPFISTEEKTFASAPLGAHIRGMFPDPCIYEEAP